MRIAGQSGGRFGGGFAEDANRRRGTGVQIRMAHCVLVLLALASAGCEDAAKRPVQARPPSGPTANSSAGPQTNPTGPQASSAGPPANSTGPQATPAERAAATPDPSKGPEKNPGKSPAKNQAKDQAKGGQTKTPAGQTSTASLPTLPLSNRNVARLAILAPQAKVGKAYLVAQVEAKFAAGEQEYKAGHLASARRAFDQAVDWLLESGYDLEADPRLAELYHRIVDRVYGYELQAFRAGDGFQETPAVAAPIDELAEMTFPVDPRMKGRAEEAAKNVSHDLPLTVNDTVLGFLNFFQTPRGRTIVETGLRRAGKYREMIS